MKIADLIRTRRTVQLINSQPVPIALVEEALELALWAPNHKLTFPWRFVLVGPEARRQLAELSVVLKEKKKGPLSESAKQSAIKNFLAPSHLVILGMTRSEDSERQKEDYAAVAAGVQNAQLFLWDNGVGTKWGTGSITHHELTYKLSGLNPLTEEIVGFLWIGHFDRQPPAPGRPALSLFLRRTS